MRLQRNKVYEVVVKRGNLLTTTPDSKAVFERLQEIMKGVTYKPGHLIEIVVDDEDVTVYLSASVVGIHSMEYIDISFVQKFPTLSLACGFLDYPKHFLEYVAFEVIRQWEEHEAKEWYMQYGKPILDPHPREERKERL
jgi:hypothetical protein